MAFIDIFNGDADGLCSLIQLRSAAPRSSKLITGVKRDIALVDQIDYAKGDEVTVLDLSFDKNRSGIKKALSAGANIQYFDHHFAGEIPASDQLETHINTASDICTSLLVDQYLKGRYRGWAVVGAFGDNLKHSATAAAKSLGLSEKDLSQLEALGIYINYNGYGASIDDLHFEPAALYQKLSPFPDPLTFISEAKEVFLLLEQGYKQDMASAATIKPQHESSSAAIFILPNETWARRVSGVYSNDLANTSPERAHAVLTEKADGTYLVSVRAPLNNKTGADEICRQFPTGGGRKAAAGINDLPEAKLGDFINTLDRFYA